MENKFKNAFSLTEIVVVTIILAILVSLALPRYFKMIEASRAKEALDNLISLRESMERCYAENHGVALKPNPQTDADVFCRFDTIDAEDPSNAPNSHFTYSIYIEHAGHYEFWAVRNSRDKGNNSGEDRISLVHDGDGDIWIQGFGVFSNIRIGVDSLHSPPLQGDHFDGPRGWISPH